MHSIDWEQPSYTAFAGSQQFATGPLGDVAIKVKKRLQRNPETRILVFDDATGKTIDLDLRGSFEDVKRRHEPPSGEIKSGPGRPKLGVVSREISLLPRHWDWLSLQPGGASVTLRKLVEEAKKKSSEKDKLRLAQEATYRFMTTMAGDFPQYEEALRALYTNDTKKLRTCIEKWPKDVREHIVKLRA